MRTIIIFLSVTATVFPQLNFDELFYDKTLRVDYFHTGNSESDFYSIDELIEEPYWGGSKVNLIDKFNYGMYKVEVYDQTSGIMIYSRTYTTLFNEWQTTDEAKQTTKSFSESFVLPFPKKPVRLEFYSRNKINELIKKYKYNLDPESYFINSERSLKYKKFEVMISGEPAKKVDIVFIPDGYTSEEMDKFKLDCIRFAGYLFRSTPFKENKDKFNIWGIMAPSEDSGTDIPAKNIWVNTSVGTAFYTFDVERYLMTRANKELRTLASYAPYDQIYIMVNSSKYGGGSIYNLYSVCVSNNRYSDYIFVHEFGHGFASLGDEYSTSDVTYEDFYSADVEPLDPNLTTLVNFESKWKDLVEEGTPIPTPNTEEYKNKVGVFEGGGYMKKGIFRPTENCTMKSISVDNFCPVCKRAIRKMIDFYTK
ncbi:MAG: M64 family metallo-endopeptidase [Ignavibacteria bacterium]|nr:M64 family metallo-endopeptidase [Ignavibacteria bacterium]